MTFTIAMIVGFGGYLLPFKMAVFSNFGLLAAGSNGAYDGSYSYASWTAFTLAIVLVMMIVYLLISKFIIKVDLSKLEAYVRFSIYTNTRCNTYNQHCHPNSSERI